MAPVELVPADTPALLAELSALAHVIWHQHYAPIIGREQVEYMLAEGYSEAALARQWAAGTRFTLARHDARYVGFAAVSLDPVDAAMAWLDKLYVHIDARGLGVGRRLVARAAAQAREADAQVLRLRVNRHNTDSIAAYQRLGFAMEGEDVKDIGGGFVMDDYLMTAPVATLENVGPQ
jgi:GNAT superfamily N-acetyltransferase